MPFLRSVTCVMVLTRFAATKTMPTWRMQRNCGRVNEAADSIATAAITHQPSLMHTWEQLCSDFQVAKRIRNEIQSVLVQVGALAINRLRGLDSAVEPNPTCDLVLQAPVMKFWCFPAVLPPEAGTFNVSDWCKLQAWSQSLQREGPVHFLSWYQLYVDFKLRYHEAGPWYQVKTLRGWSGNSMPDVGWMRRCRWFSTFWTKLAKTLGMQLPIVNRRPTGHAIAFWINCLPVQIDDDRLATIDRWLGQYKSVFYTSKELQWIE